MLKRHLLTNIVGNGSSVLVRKSILDELGGFDPWLREQCAEGCEDLLLQLRIASRYKFCEVPSYLVGYRRHAGNMSNDRDRMARSGMLAITKALSEQAIRVQPTRGALTRYQWKRFKFAIRKGDWRQATAMLNQLCRTPDLTFFAFWNDLIAIAATRTRRLAELVSLLLRRASRRRHFYDYSPTETSIRGNWHRATRPLTTTELAHSAHKNKDKGGD